MEKKYFVNQNDIHRKVLKQLRTYGFTCWSITGHKSSLNPTATPDIVVAIADGISIMLVIKTPTGKLTPEQQCNLAKKLIIVCRSPEEAVDCALQARDEYVLLQKTILNKRKGYMMKQYEVWKEGFAITGQSEKAQRLTKKNELTLWDGSTFQEACINALNKLQRDMKSYSVENNTYWGCRFFDNETDARKSFG